MTAVKLGDRVRLTAPMTSNGVVEMPAGCEGVVNWLGVHGEQIGVKWDNGRNLMLLGDVDQFEVTT